MGKNKIGKSMHTLTTIKYNSSNMTHIKKINVVKNKSKIAYDILKYDVHKLNRIIEQKIAIIEELNKQILLFVC